MFSDRWSVKKIKEKFEVRYLRLNRADSLDVMFGDDMAIVADTEHLQHNIIILKEEIQNLNMKMNIEKTKIMTIQVKNK